MEKLENIKEPKEADLCNNIFNYSNSINYNWSISFWKSLK